MSEKVEHTELPWRFSPWHVEEGPPAVRAPAGHIICTTASDDDAAYIVLACNSYPVLLAERDRLREALEKISKVEGESDPNILWPWAQEIASAALKDTNQ